MGEELKALLEEQNKAFENFKKSNDELFKTKAEGKAFSELEATVAAANADISRLSKVLDDVARKANRPGAAGDKKAHIDAEHKTAWLNWIRKGQDTGLAELEAKAFLTGDGTNKPKGLLAYPQADTNDKTRAFGTLQILKSGLADGFKASSPADSLIDMIYSLKKGHRAGAQWMTNGKTLSVLRKWKDADGNYLWQPALTAGQPSQILGYGIVENEDMPDVGANATPVLFGHYARAYWIFDRIGIRSLRDPFTNKPYVHFYTTKRVGGIEQGQDAYGGPMATWADVSMVWAAVEAVNGREFFASQQVQSEVTHKITLRHRSDVTPEWRVVCDARVFGIAAVLPDSKGTRLTLMCKELSSEQDERR